VVEFQRRIEIADAQHGVEITHVSLTPLEISKRSLLGSGISIAAKWEEGQGVAERVIAILPPRALPSRYSRRSHRKKHLKKPLHLNLHPL
jgi:hypothetical protein